MPLDPQAKLVLDTARATRVEIPPEQRVEMTRAGWGLFLQVAGGAPEPVFAVEDRDADGVPVRVYRPSPDPGLGVFVVFHGGGWVIGSMEEFDVIARQIANASNAIVVSVDYRLAPEHPYPAPLDDCWTALRWAAEHAAELGGDPSRLAVGGDSAGGNLAAACALLARDAGTPRLALQLLVYPALDAACETASYIENGKGYLLEAVQMQWFYDCYLRGGADGSDWRVSPARAVSLEGAAPAFVITAEFDPLRDEGDAYARALAEAGVAVTHSAYEGMIHAFFGLTAMFDDATVALDETARALRAAFGTLA